METPDQPAPHLNDEVDGAANTLTTTKKIEANRRNAQFSTGPKSPEGRKIVAGNARKHCLLAKNLVIDTGPGMEDQAEFDRLLAELREYYKPVGKAEELCVEEMAISYWKSARALRCERGEVTLGSVIPPPPPDLSLVEELFLESNSNLARHGLLKTSTGINFLLKKIEEARKYVDTNGFVPQESLRFLPQNPGPSWLHASDKQALQKALDNEKTELQARKILVEAEERSQRRARINAAAVPSKTPLERLDRYETSNRRHRYKLEKRLEELQSRRREHELTSGVHKPAEEFFTKQSQDVL